MKHLIRSVASWLRGSFRPHRYGGKQAAKSQPDAKRVGSICDVVIGLDFGTSCTKIVVRTPYERDRAFAVPFGPASHASSLYLLPSALWVSDSGEASLTSLRNGVHVRDVKYYLMQSKRDLVVTGDDGPVTLDSHAVAVAFLALALTHTRRWFADAHKSSYADFVLDWQVNIGLPSADFANRSLCHDYLRIAAAAWHLSAASDKIDLSSAKNALEVQIKRDDAASGVGGFVDCQNGPSAEVKLIPEVAAEVVGYARSHLRDEGLHILMDIGARTLDVCSFILHEKDGDDRYELLTADVRELGAMVLHRNRVEVIRSTVPDQTLSKLVHWDPVEPIPDPIEQHLSPEPERVLLDRIQDSDLTYSKKCSQMVWQTLIDLKTRRDPHSKRWHEGMPVFLAGGAKDMRFYQEAIGQISSKVEEMYPPCRGVLPLAMTKPDNLEAEISDNGYHRLAVAFGLSYPETDIGMVTRPGDIEDVPPRRRAKPQRPFVSKDMV